MGARNETITVRIRADYAKAAADMQKFTGSVDHSFGALPKVVQGVTTSVDALTGRIDKVDMSFQALPKTVREVSTSVDKLTAMIDKLGQNVGPVKLKSKLSDANKEASTLSKTLETIERTGKGIGAGMAAWHAGKAVLAPSVNKTMDYDMRLAFATNIAMPTGTVAQKYAVEKEINTKLEAARIYGGGQREDILEAYEALVGRGAIGDKDQSLQVMPGIVKTAYTAHASPKDMANAASGLVMGLKVAPKDVELGLAQLFYSGQTGGFEVRDMSKVIGKQAGFAHQAGYQGLSGNATVAALNQIGFNFAGSADEAGTNVTDFLKSMTSAHLGQNLKRFSYDKENHTLVKDEGNKRKGKNYLDLGSVLADNQAKGIGSIDTMIQIMQMINEGNPKLQQAAKKLAELNAKIDAARAKGDESSKLQLMLEAKDHAGKAVDILKGSSAGQLFHNQQEMLGFIGVLADPDGFHRMVKNTEEHGTLATVSGDHQFLSSHAGYKAEMYEEDKAAALYQGMAGFNDALGKTAGFLSDFYQKNPALASALEGGKLFVDTMAASAGAASAVMFILTGNARAAALALGGVAVAGGGKSLAGSVPAGVAAAAPGLGAAFKSGLKLNGAMMLATGAYDAYTIANDDSLSSQQKKIQYAGVAGGTVGGTVGGAAAGAAVGSVVPVFGTAIGGIIGAGIGYWGGRKLGTSAGEAMFGGGDEQAKKNYLDNLTKQTASAPPVAASAVKGAFDQVIPAIALPVAAMTVQQQTSPKNPSVVPISFAPYNQEASPAIQKQMNTSAPNSEVAQRAMLDGLKPLPVEARIKLDVAFNESGRPYVQQKSVEGKGIRLDTGPMMTR